jgi:uncharacterized membrane protein
LRVARVAQWTLSLAIGLWAVTMVAAPTWLFPLCGFICHQRPERSFFLDGSQLPLCARCSGLYAGAAAAAPLALFIASPLNGSRARMIALGAALPTAITWTLEFTGVAPFSNMMRFVAALPLGFVAAWLVVGVLADD